MKKEIAAENIIWPDDSSRKMTRPRYKTRYSPNEENAKTVPVSTWINPTSSNVSIEDELEDDVFHLSAGLNQEGTQQLRELMGEQVLDYPKPVSLMRSFVKLATRNDDIILDFFAGQCSTAHAVLEQNQEDGYARRFVMVQLAEKVDKDAPSSDNGFESIADRGKERIRRVAAKMTTSRDPDGPDIDTGFRVLKVDSSNMKDVYYKPESVTQSGLTSQTENIKEDRTPEDLLFQVLLDLGLDLSLPIAKEVIAGKNVFFVDGNALVACFDRDIDEELVKNLANYKPLRAVFRDSGFSSDSVKINAQQVFSQVSPRTDLKSI